MAIIFDSDIVQGVERYVDGDSGGPTVDRIIDELFHQGGRIRKYLARPKSTDGVLRESCNGHVCSASTVGSDPFPPILISLDRNVCFGKKENEQS